MDTNASAPPQDLDAPEGWHRPTEPTRKIAEAMDLLMEVTVDDLWTELGRESGERSRGYRAKKRSPRDDALNEARSQLRVIKHQTKTLADALRIPYAQRDGLDGYRAHPDLQKAAPGPDTLYGFLRTRRDPASDPEAMSGVPGADGDGSEFKHLLDAPAATRNDPTPESAGTSLPSLADLLAGCLDEHEGQNR